MKGRKQNNINKYVSSLNGNRYNYQFKTNYTKTPTLMRVQHIICHMVDDVVKKKVETDRAWRMQSDINQHVQK